MKKFILSILLGMLFVSFGYSTHVIGGEITYKCLGNNQYELTLKVYRDCYNGIPPFDNPAIITAFDDQGGLLDVFELFLPFSSIDTLPVEVFNPCLSAPPNVCVEEAVYTKVVDLPPIPGGYHLVYQRCCRNHTILNIDLPGQTGSSYYTVINDTAVVDCNSSPAFKNFPPVALCIDDTIRFDHSAFDPDGDSLVYELCDPYVGGSENDPVPNPGTPPPYDFVKFSTGYSGSYPLDAAPALSIGSKTGLLYGTPKKVGQYVVGVCVKEYRDGVLLGVNKRDFQFNIVNCLSKVIAATPSEVMRCDGTTIDFKNDSKDATFFHWDFGIPGINTDTSTLANPSYNFPDTGIYTITLIANPGYTCADTAYATLGVYPTLTPDYEFVSACADEELIFTDLSTSTYGNIISWEWDFGDSFGKSTDQNPKYKFFVGGNYNVKMITETDIGCRDSLILPVEVYHEPDADFITGPGCVNSEIEFTNNSSIADGQIISSLWNFGDNSGTNELNPKHVYTNTGVVQVELVVISDNNCLDTIIKPLLIQALPVSNAGNDVNFCSGDTAQLGTDPVLGMLYSWSPTEGLNDSTISDPTVTLTNDKAEYKVQVYTVSTTELVTGCTSFDEVNVGVYPLPVPQLADQEGQCIDGNAFTYNTIGNFNASTSYSWNFGPDASPSSSSTKTPTDIRYSKAGDHPLSLTVTENGCVETIYDTITIYPLIRPEFQFDVAEGCQPLRVDFIDNSISGTPLTYTWNFGDGESSTEENPSHVFENAGNFNVHLTITSVTGCIDTISTVLPGTVKVFPKPSAGITADPLETTIIEPDVIFIDNSLGASGCSVIIPYGDTITYCDGNYSFLDTGTFIISQIVTNNYGCLDTAYERIRINPEYKLTIPNAFTPTGDGRNETFAPKGIGVLRFEMFIYHRWGQLIYETTDIEKGWDGKANGGSEIAQQDVYVYVIKVRDVFLKDHRYIGKFTLVK